MVSALTGLSYLIFGFACSVRICRDPNGRNKYKIVFDRHVLTAYGLGLSHFAIGAFVAH